MKTHLLALILLGITAFAQAADLTMTVTTDPPPPWSDTEPVVLRLTLTNQANVARRGWYEIRDIDRTARLIDRIRLRAGSVPAIDLSVASDVCGTFQPNYDNVLTWCDTTVPILPGDSLTISYDVIAFPGAVGYRDAYYELYPMTADTLLHAPGAPVVQVPVRIAYGFLPRIAIPTTGNVAVAMLVFALLLVASWRMNADTRLRGSRS